MPRGMREQKHSSRIRQADVIASMLSELSAENIRKCPSLVLIFPFIFVQSAEIKTIDFELCRVLLFTTRCRTKP